MYPNKGHLLKKSAVRDGRKWAEKERLLGGVCWRRSLEGVAQVAVSWAVPQALALDHRMHSAVGFCDSSFAIMVSKAPSGPSGSQELRAHHTERGLGFRV